MEAARQLEEDLRIALEDLHRRAMADERLNRNPDHNEKRCKEFANEWEDRLIEERKNLLVKLDAALTEKLANDERASREANNLADAKAYEEFDVTTRQKMFNATDRSTEPRDIHTAAGKEKHQAIFQEAAAQIQAHADRLQDGMQDAVKAIQSGKDPSYEFLEQARRQRAALDQQQRQEQEQAERLRLTMKP
jgi:hypothetical protein